MWPTEVLLQDACPLTIPEAWTAGDMAFDVANQKVSESLVCPGRYEITPLLVPDSLAVSLWESPKIRDPNLDPPKY